MSSALGHPSHAAPEASPADRCRFIGLRQFDDFTAENAGTNAALLSPVIKAPMAWNELVVSWNVAAVKGGALKVEARGIYPDHETKFFTLGVWSPAGERHSVGGQKDADGNVKTDTWIATRPGADAQLRLTLSGARTNLKFLGLSFLNSRVEAAPLAAHRAAWGKIIATTERSQHGYAQEKGWCSPTSLSMVLTRWSEVLRRPEMNLDVPEVAKAVFDSTFDGTGNWPFNTAFAGSFEGMRAYVTRLSDIAELEEWIDAGIPVIISAPWHLLSPGRRNTGEGHVVVCIGFTEDGDVVINDPGTNLQKGQHVRHVYRREDVIKAWQASKNTVYLVYPEGAKIPDDRFGHWDKPRGEGERSGPELNH
jgi:hypothetical protein